MGPNQLSRLGPVRVDKPTTWLHHDAGLPWEEVSHILGHHNVAFTIATYVRRGADTENEVRARLAKF